MSDPDLVVQHVVPNNNSRLKVATLLYDEDGESVVYHDIVAWAVFINGCDDVHDDMTLCWSMPVISNGFSHQEYVVFDSVTEEWWTKADLSGEGEESLLEYLVRRS